MQIDDTTGTGWTRRWTLVAGFPACIEDALAPGHPAAPLAIARNAAVRSLVIAVEAFEAAQRVPAPAEDAPENDHSREAYANAQTLLEAADDIVKAHACVRAGEPSDESSAEHDAWLVAVPTVDAALDAATDTNTVGALSALKAGAVAWVNAARDGRLYGGFTVPGTVSAALAGKVLQTRRTDAVNWLTSQASYLAAVMAGQGAFVGATFRTADDGQATVSFQEGLNILLAMAAWGAGVYAASWALKNAIAAAGDLSTLDAVDLEAGWP